MPSLTRFRATRAIAPAVLLVLAGITAGCATSGAAGTQGGGGDGLPVLDSAKLIRDVFLLAHDSMAGRATGTPQHAKARAWLESEFRRLRLQPVGVGYLHPFASPRRNGADTVRGVNILGTIRGSRDFEKVIVVSAHYDHLGTRNGQVHNGADDNASGTAAVLAMAAWFRAHPPEHTILFALWDAEEMGLVGARAFVATPPVRLARVVANVNLDMVSRNDKGELFAAGSTPWPQMKPVLNGLIPSAAVTLRLGHDSGGGQDDWTSQSDQGAFHAAKIPFVYFGVEDHPDYHKATDDPERIQPGFYHRSARTITAFVARLDRAVAKWPPRAP
jgi:Zn-dependent M28 family amino/carboxypeptidase